MLLIGLALAAPSAPKPVEPPRPLVMHADPTIPGGWWVETAGSGRPLDTLALAKILRNVDVPRELEQRRHRAVIGRTTFGVLAGVTFVGGAMLAGSAPQPVVAGPEPEPGGYEDVETFRAAHETWTLTQAHADTRDEVLTDAMVLLAGSALCVLAVPLVGADQPAKLRHPGLVWTNEAAVDEIDAYNRRVRASLELAPNAVRLRVDLP